MLYSKTRPSALAPKPPSDPPILDYRVRELLKEAARHGSADALPDLLRQAGASAALQSLAPALSEEVQRMLVITLSRWSRAREQSPGRWSTFAAYCGALTAADAVDAHLIDGGDAARQALQRLFPPPASKAHRLPPGCSY